jgi:SAM-dependent methyltransferase
MTQPGNEVTGRGSTSETPLQSDWAARQQALGNVPQAVLLRNLPAGVNGLLDTWHRAVLRWSLAPLACASSGWIADLGCGYGRMATEVEAMGFANVIGLDYEAGFCRQYQLDHGYAVRGSIAQPPFAASSLSGAYAITAFMYVGLDRAIEGLKMLDTSLLPGARMLLMEAGAEFHRASRRVLRQKRTQSLAVSGFSRSELSEALLPHGWRKIASGSNAGTTMLLPLMLAFCRWPRVFDTLSAAAMHLDRPRPGFRDRGLRRFCLHRWVLCEKPLSAPPA